MSSTQFSASVTTNATFTAEAPKESFGAERSWALATVKEHLQNLRSAKDEAEAAGDAEAAARFQEQIEVAEFHLKNVSNDSMGTLEYAKRVDDVEVEYESTGLEEVEDKPAKPKREKNLVKRSTEEWRALLKSDPEQFAADMKKLGEDDPHMAQMVTMGIQEAVQAENRTWSMMTAMSQAEHDTAKAIISNFRV